MKRKKELLKECIKILKNNKKVEQWYQENLENRSQHETINSLQDGISKGHLSIREALVIAIVVGLQWNEKFEKENPHGDVENKNEA